MTSKKRLRFVQVDISGEPTRTRSKHRKARTGCKNCKLRKVKCDERLPRCGACERRDQPCDRLQTNAPSITTSVVSEEPEPYLETYPLDLVAIKLFYVFQQLTADTICLGGRLWQDLIPLAFEKQYFMHAILSLAAAHQQAIGQDESALMNQVTLHHQVEAIHGLRAVTEGGTQQTQDAVVGTALLLYHHTWATPDQDNELFPYQSLLPIAALPYKEVMLGTVFKGPSMWQPIFVYSPKLALEAFSMHTTLADELQVFFDEQFRLICPDESLDSQQFGIFTAQSRRLIPVVAVILLRAGETANQSEWITSSVVRYLATWPLLCSGEFLEMERRKDPLAYVILWQYFMAIDRCGIPSMWWTRKRTKFALEHARSELHVLGVEVPNVFDAFEKPKDVRGP